MRCFHSLFAGVDSDSLSNSHLQLRKLTISSNRLCGNKLDEAECKALYSLVSYYRW